VSTPQEVDEPIDGRTARAVRTREAIVDACIELVEAGDLRPTAPRIAERAGVSVRSIFQHFDDLETLFGAVGEQVFRRLAVLVTPIDEDGPLPDRLAAFVAQRATLNEAMTPILMAASIHAATSPVVHQQFEAGHRFFRSQVAQIFATELEAAGARAPALLDAIALITSWPSWDLLRHNEGRSAAEAATSVRQAIEILLGG